MEFQDIKSTIEGILFASGEPVPLARLCQVLEQDKNTVDSSQFSSEAAPGLWIYFW